MKSFTLKAKAVAAIVTLTSLVVLSGTAAATAAHVYRAAPVFKAQTICVDKASAHKPVTAAPASCSVLSRQLPTAQKCSQRSLPSLKALAARRTRCTAAKL